MVRHLSAITNRTELRAGLRARSLPSPELTGFLRRGWQRWILRLRAGALEKRITRLEKTPRAKNPIIYRLKCRRLTAEELEEALELAVRVFDEMPGFRRLRRERGILEREVGRRRGGKTVS